MVFLNTCILLFVLIGCASVKIPTTNEKLSKYLLPDNRDQYSKVLDESEDKILSSYLSSSKYIALQLKKNILYVKLFSFYKGGALDIEHSLNRYKCTKGIILDLRDNGGGLLDEALNIVDLFIDKGILLKRVGKKKISFDYAHQGHHALPLVILVNKQSASASEIVAGVLQEKKRAWIVGSRTFGKGSIQEVGSYYGNSFKVTTEYYYLPSGKNIEKVGIIPDIEIKKNEMIQISNIFPLQLKKLYAIPSENKDTMLLIAKILLDEIVAKRK